MNTKTPAPKTRKRYLQDKLMTAERQLEKIEAELAATEELRRKLKQNRNFWMATYQETDQRLHEEFQQ